MAISDFYLVYYFDKDTDELVRVEQYSSNNSAQSDIDSYKYGYYANVYQPEELLDLYTETSKDLQQAMDNYVQLDNKRVKEYNELVERYNDKEQECKNWQSELDIAHLLMLEKQDELVKKILQYKELEDEKLLLEIQVAELTSPVNIEDCPHSIFNGEDVYCRYYEGCKCSDLDFANCMFKENVRLKKKIQELKEEVDANKMLS